VAVKICVVEEVRRFLVASSAGLVVSGAVAVSSSEEEVWVVAVSYSVEAVWFTDFGFIILLKRKRSLGFKGLRMMESQNSYTMKIMVVVLVIGLLGGIVSAALVVPFFLKAGPLGETGATGLTGAQGPQGEQGPQGLPGNSGTNGIDAILQMAQNRNTTAVDVSASPMWTWINMSMFDSSMNMAIDVQQNSKLFVEFSTSHTLNSGASIMVRIVVDNVYNSTVYRASSSSPSSVTSTFPGHVEFLTGPLNSGQHTIEVQFQRNVGGPSTVLERALTATEITTP